VISGAGESATASGRRPASVPRPSGSCIRLRRPAALLAASFVRVIQPGARARAQGLTEGRSRPPEERIGDVLLAVAGVCLSTSANVDRHDVGRPCCSFATLAIARGAGRELAEGRKQVPHAQADSALLVANLEHLGVAAAGPAAATGERPSFRAEGGPGACKIPASGDGCSQSMRSAARRDQHKRFATDGAVRACSDPANARCRVGRVGAARVLAAIR
jgi:hypothetical protein